MTHVFTSSPNWYLSRIIDISDDQVVAYGARSDLNILQLRAARAKHKNIVNSSIKAHEKIVTSDIVHDRAENRGIVGFNNKCKKQGNVIDSHSTHDDHNSRGCMSNTTQSKSNGEVREEQWRSDCNSSDLSADGTSNATNLLLKNSHEGNFGDNSSFGDTSEAPVVPLKGSDFNDCVLISTMTRLHKDKVTAVRLLKRLSVNGETDGLKHHSYSLFTGADDGKIKHHHLSWYGDAFVKLPVITSKLESEHVLPKNCKVSCLEVCNEQLVIGDDKGNITSWQWKTGLTNSIKLGNSPITVLQFEANDHLLAIGMRNGGIFIYNPQIHQTVVKLKGHDDEIHSLQWRPTMPPVQHGIDGGLVSGSKDRTIRLWNLSTKRCMATGKVPTPPGGGNRSRMIWLSLAWLPTGQVISSSFSGELLVCTFVGKTCQWTTLVEGSCKGHSRLVFTLNLFQEGKKLLSTSMDRSIIVWDIKASPVENTPPVETEELSAIEAEGHIATNDEEGLWARAEKPVEKKPEAKRTCGGRILMNIPTFGGFCYCIRASPVDPGRLAVGVGDDVIRLWNVNEGTSAYSVTNLWQGLKSKVSSVAWHPLSEGHLAYGTEDGRVGVFPALGKKAPIICGTYHQKMVYVVAWGPQLLTDDAVTGQSLNVYSVGDGTVLIHNIAKASSEPAKDLNQLLSKSNPTLPANKVRSEICFSQNFSLIYLGSDDGSVMILKRSNLQCICMIKVASKLVNAIRLQPAADDGSARLMAIGSNEHHVKVVDTSRVSQVLTDTVPIINEAAVTLKGHKARVTDMCWSSFSRQHLLTVSYDGKAFVWDTVSGSILSEYKYQHGHLLTCQWSLLDSDLVYTGSADCCLHSWRPSLYKRLACEPKDAEAGKGDAGQQDTALDSEEIERLIEEKKRSLVAEVGEIKDPASSSSTSHPESNESLETNPTKQSLPTRLKKKMGKTLFPNMTAATKKGKNTEIDDLIYLQTQISAGQSVTSSEGYEHLGIFSPENEEDMSRFLEKEKETLWRDENFEGAGYMCLWQGNVEESLKKAATAGALTDCLINSASMLGYTEWIKYCKLYAQQLRGERQVHKASAYLLYAHDVETAILWLTEDNLYREAISIARSRYPPADTRISSLYQAWAKQLRRDANYETAAKCFVSIADPLSGLGSLSRRTGGESAVNAIKFAMSSSEMADEMIVMCDSLTRQSLLSGDYQVIEDLCSPHVQLHPFYAWSIVSQSLLPVLQTGLSDEISNIGIVDYLRQVLSTRGVQLKHCRKRCSLSQSHVSTQQAEIGVCERLLNMAVDVEEGTTPACKELVDVFAKLVYMHPNFEGEAPLLPARLIQLFTYPGSDVIQRLTKCSIKPLQSLEDYSLYICSLWSALTLAIHNSGQPLPQLSLTEDTEATVTSSPTLVSAVSSHIEQLAVFLCDGISLPYMDSGAMERLNDHLMRVETSVTAGENPPHIDMVDLLSFVDKKNPEPSMDGQTAKCVLMLLLDTLRQLFTLMCHHTSHNHLTDSSTCRHLIREWVQLHANCSDWGSTQ
ncbi:gem-associated protein 5-like [Watersipora subatra]|uniref:gem-associated protein 5-like n=1 Tax=Watersipora subatra TaxID=2589382 RepID=UPI00355B801D